MQREFVVTSLTVLLGQFAANWNRMLFVVIENHIVSLKIEIINKIITTKNNQKGEKILMTLNYIYKYSYI